MKKGVKKGMAFVAFVVILLILFFGADYIGKDVAKYSESKSTKNVEYFHGIIAEMPDNWMYDTYFTIAVEPKFEKGKRSLYPVSVIAPKLLLEQGYANTHKDSNDGFIKPPSSGPMNNMVWSRPKVGDEITFVAYWIPRGGDKGKIVYLMVPWKD